MATLGDLVRLSAGRWTMPLLGMASAGRGLRFAEAVKTLGLARPIARRTLDELVAEGWLTRNPGHGHPLRPEYVPTTTGAVLGVWCAAVMAERTALGLTPDALTRWTLPVVAEIARGRTRFAEIAAALVPVSPRALSLTLKSGIAAGLIERRLEDGFPPAPLYGLSERGRRLAGVLSL